MAEKVTALLKKGGLERRPVLTEEARSIEPTLKGDIYGGLYTETDFTGDMHKFTSFLAAACTRRVASMRLSTIVEKLRADKGKIEIFSRIEDKHGSSAPGRHKEVFDKVEICAGVHSRKFAQMLGDRLNVYPVKGYSITVNLEDEADQAAAPKASLLDDNAKLVTSRLGGIQWLQQGYRREVDRPDAEMVSPPFPRDAAVSRPVTSSPMMHPKRWPTAFLFRRRI